MADDLDAATSTSDPASSEHETWLSTFFGTQPQAADPVTPAGEAPCSTSADHGEAASSVAAEAKAVDPDTATAPEGEPGPAFIPTGKLFQPGDEPVDPGPGLNPETGEPLDRPEPQGATPDPDMDPETGEPRDPPPRPPSAPDPDIDPETGEPRDMPPTTPEGVDPDFDPATGGPPSSQGSAAPPPDGTDPGPNGTEHAPTEDPEADVGRGSGPGDATPGGPAPVERVLLGLPQSEQAGENLNKLPPAERDKVVALMVTASGHSPEEIGYFIKALAAGHSVAELAQFQKQIAGKDPAWMEEHLRLVGGSSGKGIKQQWSHSCAPTEVEAMKGELDPIYALQLREKNPHLDQADDKDGDRINPNLANEQFNLLTQIGGVVAPRGDEANGRGGKMSTLLNSEGGGMGLTFDRKEIGADVTMDQALATTQDRLKAGMPVPICVGTQDNPYAHAAMIVAVEDGPPRRFSIHDPWTGSVKTYDEADIRAGKLDVASCKSIAAIYPPNRT